METSSLKTLKIMPETSWKLYVHKIGFCQNFTVHYVAGEIVNISFSKSFITNKFHKCHTPNVYLATIQNTAIIRFLRWKTNAKVDYYVYIHEYKVENTNAINLIIILVDYYVCIHEYRVKKKNAF